MHFSVLAPLLLAAASGVLGFYDPTFNANVAVYWEQNSVCNEGGGPGSYQNDLVDYCGEDNNVDIVIIAFITGFYPNGTAKMNLANYGGKKNCKMIGEHLDVVKSCENLR
ncbi:hypothetical protein K458DRAFT_383669 [Lentithecium fluviatile CBS 122367]|uniref:Glycoside hydrolase family 18 protein n=1 Tax=Lentithecium fluviatile CBS 122367 TaxID=1168545 RepID=A0A6G1JJ31_9PLEO|nr:hypothetical protein K458DRAFT_383669 [Lentithecium fluviatile CBS 122367]